MGPYKPLRNWVDEFIPYLYGNNGSLDPDFPCVLFCLRSFHTSLHSYQLRVMWEAGGGFYGGPGYSIAAFWALTGVLPVCDTIEPVKINGRHCKHFNPIEKRARGHFCFYR